MKRKQERAHRILEEVVTHKIVAIWAARHPDWIAAEANALRLAVPVRERCTVQHRALSCELGFQMALIQSGKQRYHQLSWSSLFPVPTAWLQSAEVRTLAKILSQDAKYQREVAGFGELIRSSCNLGSSLCNLIKRKKPISQPHYWCGYFHCLMQSKSQT